MYCKIRSYRWIMFTFSARYMCMRCCIIKTTPKEKVMYVMVDVFLVVLYCKWSSSFFQTLSFKGNVWRKKKEERLKSIFLIPLIFIDAWSWIVIHCTHFECGDFSVSQSVFLLPSNAVFVLLPKGKIINIGNIEILMRCTAPDRGEKRKNGKKNHDL